MLLDISTMVDGVLDTINAVIGKMFGSRHPPAPKLFFDFSGNFGAERRAFLK